MKFSHSAAVLLLAGSAAVLSACAPSTEADEAAIHAQNKKWQELIVAKDAKGVAGLYAEDGQMLPPNSAKAVGREAIEKGWAGFMGLPGMALTFETEKFIFAKSADLAVETGTYKFTAGGQTDTGKSVVTWTKRKGQWYVLTDMFSSDAPPAPPAPAPAPAPATGSPTDAAPPEVVAPATPPAQ